MKPPYAVYVLETEWRWDHINRELATMTVEGRENCRWQPDLEKLIDPGTSEDVRQRILGDLLALARAQNQSPHPNTEPHLIRLYRVVDDSSSRSDDGTMQEIRFHLEVVCAFENNVPVRPIPQKVM